MSAIKFPSNPVNGQQYSAPNGIVYTFDSIKWVGAVVGSTINSIGYGTYTIYINTSGNLVIPNNSIITQQSGSAVASTALYLLNAGKILALTTSGSVVFPDGTVQRTAYTATSTLVNGSFAVSLGADGRLTLPRGLIIDDTGISAPEQSYFNLVSSGQTGSINLNWSSTLSNTSSLQTAGIGIGLYTNNLPGVQISTFDPFASNPDSFQNWTFDWYGNIEMPDGTTLGTSRWMSPIGGMAIKLDDAFVQITPLVNGIYPVNPWTFGVDGTLTLPSTGAKIANNVTFTGSVTFANTTTYSQSINTVYTDNILEIHAPTGGINGVWAVNDGKDIGLRMHYFSTATGDSNAALVLAQDTGSLEWYSNGTESNGHFSGTYGIIKTGGINLTNAFAPIRFQDGTFQNTAFTGTGTQVAYATTSGFANSFSTGTMVANAVQAGSATRIQSGGGTQTVYISAGRFYVNPIRYNGTAVTPGGVMIWNTVTQEVTYGPLPLATNSTMGMVVVDGLTIPINSTTGVISVNTATLMSNAVTAGYANSFNTATQVASAVSANTVTGGYIKSIAVGTGTFISGVATGNVTIWTPTTQGTTGAQGTAIQGTTGAQGVTGSQGVQGVQGVTGAQGVTGSQGVASAQGTTGAQGVQGVQGTAGNIGNNGNQGTTGAQGVTGTGTQGTTGTGNQGTTGAQGVTGTATQGVTGSQGVTGVQGVTGSGSTTSTLTGTSIILTAKTAVLGAVISGELTSNTYLNRLMFQTTVTNAGSSLGIIPNGTPSTFVENSYVANFVAYNSSNSNNTSYLALGLTQTDARISTSYTGASSYVPMTFYTSNSERLRVGVNGQVTVNTTASTSGEIFSVNGGAYINGIVTATNVIYANTLTGIANTGSVQIQSIVNGVTSNWTFNNNGTTGTITFPDSTVQTTAYLGNYKKATGVNVSTGTAVALNTIKAVAWNGFIYLQSNTATSVQVVGQAEQLCFGNGNVASTITATITTSTLTQPGISSPAMQHIGDTHLYYITDISYNFMYRVTGMLTGVSSNTNYNIVVEQLI